MNAPRNPNSKRTTTAKEESPIISFTRVIAVAPRTHAFDGWGPARWN